MIGIGGIGMSALARYFLKRGVQVAGYDRTRSKLTSALESDGIAIHYDIRPEAIPGKVDLAVVTPAVPSENEEIKHLENRGVPVKKRAEVLGMISEGQHCLAVAGTHGKTTTTSMLAHIINEARSGVTAFVGGIMANFNSNFVDSGTSDTMVVEADEFDRSFLHLSPAGAVITSVDADHLDIYGRHDTLKESFVEFAEKIDKDGVLVVHEPVAGLFENIPARVIAYGISETARSRAANVRVENGLFHFDMIFPEQKPVQVALQMPGRYNVENALAAATLAFYDGIKPEAIAAALNTYRGVKRRFEFVYRDDNIVYIDDYAHHPEELRSVISAVRELFPGRKVTGIFQPHLFSRTRDFAEGFASSLALLDELILLDIYPAREKPIAGVSSQALLEMVPMKNKRLVADDKLINYLKTIDIDVLLTLGAGDIDRFAGQIKNLLAA